PSNPVIDAAIREALLSRVDIPIDYFTEYLDPEPLADVDASQALAGYMARKYAGQHIAVVIAVTDQSFRFALDHRADLFSDAPIVYMGLSTPDAAIRTGGPGVTGVQVSNAYGQTLSAALAMHPGTERVFVVANAPDAAQVARTRSELA